MKILPPLRITSRLMAGVKIGEATVSIEYAHTLDGRQVYRWLIDLASGGEFQGEDLRSGAGGGTLQEGLENLLCFLGAFAESRKWCNGDCEDGNCRLFPEGLSEWAVQNSDEIDMLECELEEHPGEFIVE